MIDREGNQSILVLTDTDMPILMSTGAVLDVLNVLVKSVYEGIVR